MQDHKNGNIFFQSYQLRYSLFLQYGKGEGAKNLITVKGGKILTRNKNNFFFFLYFQMFFKGLFQLAILMIFYPRQYAMPVKINLRSLQFFNFSLSNATTSVPTKVGKARHTIFRSDHK